MEGFISWFEDNREKGDQSAQNYMGAAGSGVIRWNQTKALGHELEPPCLNRNAECDPKNTISTVKHRGGNVML